MDEPKLYFSENLYHDVIEVQDEVLDLRIRLMLLNFHVEHGQLVASGLSGTILSRYELNGTDIVIRAAMATGITEVMYYSDFLYETQTAISCKHL